MKLAKLALFLFIAVFSFGILNVAIGYFNPNFEAGFLKGKSDFYSQAIFRISLISHGISASICVVLLSILVFFRIEKKFPIYHRTIGKIVLLSTLIVVFPSGFILSFYADGEKMGRILFLLLSVLTLYSAFQGWIAVKNRLFKNHQLWMQFLLLLFSSAFILRLIIVCFFFMKIHSKSIYSLEVFLSWVPTSIIFWMFNYRKLTTK